MATITNNTARVHIPAGTEIVMCQNKDTQTYVWYTTKKAIELNGLAVTVQNCPIREIPVVSALVSGFRVWFLETDTRTELTADQMQAAANMQLHLVEYDIPVVVARRNVISHPSTYFWRYGVRTSGSMWVMPHGSIPWVGSNGEGIRAIKRAGCVVKVTKIDVSEACNKIQEAIAALQTARMEAIDGAKKNTDAANARHAERGAGRVSDKTLTQDLKRIEKALAEDLENVKNGAKALGIPESWLERKAIHSINAAVVKGNIEKCEEIGKIVDAARASGHPGIANMVEKNEMPAYAAKDYLEENGVFSLVDDESK